MVMWNAVIMISAMAMLVISNKYLKKVSGLYFNLLLKLFLWSLYITIIIDIDKNKYYKLFILSIKIELKVISFEYKIFDLIILYA